MAFAVLTAQNSQADKFGGKNSVKTNPFSVRFSVCMFFGERLFASKSEEFAQNPFCKRDLLRDTGSFSV